MLDYPIIFLQLLSFFLISSSLLYDDPALVSLPCELMDGFLNL